MTALDDPIWHALTTEHRALARSYGEAHRYPPDIAAFVAAHSFDDLRRLVAPGERLGTFTAEPVELPPGWTLMHERWIEQMVYEGEHGRLAAMAGERLRLTGATEISAVCTHPDFQGHGYGRRLMEALIARIQASGGQPFLHVKNENGAKRLYERLGFRVRREIRLTVFSAQAETGE